jgi:hypothetical protein
MRCHSGHISRSHHFGLTAQYHVRGFMGLEHLEVYLNIRSPLMHEAQQGRIIPLNQKDVHQ